MEKEEFDNIKLGDRIGFVSGPGEFPQDNQGTVMAKMEDEWGYYIGIRTDNGNNETVESFTEVGIGCYRLG